MRRAIIIYRVDQSDASNIGVLEKLQGQKAALQESGLAVDTITHDKEHIYKNEEIVFSKKKSQKMSQFKFLFYSYLPPLSNFQYYFIRYTIGTPGFINWISSLRQKNKEAKIILDMPTYPYASEWSGLKGKFMLFIDRQIQKKLYKFVDLVLHSGAESRLFNIPTYHLTNGVNVDQIRVQSSPSQRLDKTLRMVAVAKWQYWHGLDRILDAMARVTYDVHLDVVGEGPEKNNLIQLSKDLGIEHLITWYDVMYGEDLNAIIEKADIAIGTLGLFRKNVLLDSSLKHRLYCSRGIPFVLSSPDEDFPPTLPFVQYVNNDERPINFEEVIVFAQKTGEARYFNEIIRYAQERLTWTKKIQNLLTYLEAS